MQSAKLHEIGRMPLVCAKVSGADRGGLHAALALFFQSGLQCIHHALAGKTVLIEQQHGISTLIKRSLHTFIVSPTQAAVLCRTDKPG